MTSPAEVSSHASRQPMADLVTKLTEARRATSSGGTFAALIDPAQLPEAMTDLHQNHRTLRCVPLATPIFERGAAHLAPTLVPLLEGPARDALLADTVQWALAGSGVSWLSSRYPLDQLSAALGQRLVAILPGEVRVLLRYFDTRVLPVLPTVFTVPQCARFFEPILTWTYLDRTQSLQRLPVDLADDPIYDDEPPLRLDAEQEQALLEAALPDDLLHAIHASQPDLLAGMDHAAQHRFVARQTEYARQFNIATPRDLAAYCIAARMEGESFFDAAPWRDVLERVKAGDVDFTTAATSAARTL